MSEKSLSKLNRKELLDLLYEQQKRIEELEAENEALNQELQNRQININKVGSIAEASLVLSKVFVEAQKAADNYLYNVKRIADEGKLDKYELPNRQPQNVKQQPVQKTQQPQQQPRVQQAQPQQSQRPVSQKSADQKPAYVSRHSKKR